MYRYRKNMGQISLMFLLIFPLLGCQQIQKTDVSPQTDVPKQAEVSQPAATPSNQTENKLGQMDTKLQQEESADWQKVPIDMEKTKELQSQVDNGHRPGLLDPEQVVMDYSLQVLKINGSDSITSEKISNEKVLVHLTFKDGKMMEFQLVQPVRKDPTGIWLVEKYRYVN